MTREAEVAAILTNDTTLTAILTGGIYTQEEVGVEGIRRGGDTLLENPTKDAFDADGFLKPCVLIREGSIAPYGNIRNPADKFMAVAQAIYIYYYQMREHDQIDAAKLRVYVLLEGVRLGRSYPIWMEGESLPMPDTGPIMNSTTVVQNWQCVSTRQAALA